MMDAEEGETPPSKRSKLVVAVASEPARVSVDEGKEDSSLVGSGVAEEEELATPANATSGAGLAPILEDDEGASDAAVAATAAVESAVLAALQALPAAPRPPHVRLADTVGSAVDGMAVDTVKMSADLRRLQKRVEAAQAEHAAYVAKMEAAVAAATLASGELDSAERQELRELRAFRDQVLRREVDPALALVESLASAGAYASLRGEASPGGNCGPSSRLSRLERAALNAGTGDRPFKDEVVSHVHHIRKIAALPEALDVKKEGDLVALRLALYEWALTGGGTAEPAFDFGRLEPAHARHFRVALFYTTGDQTYYGVPWVDHLVGQTLSAFTEVDEEAEPEEVLQEELLQLAFLEGLEALGVGPQDDRTRHADTLFAFTGLQWWRRQFATVHPQAPVRVEACPRLALLGDGRGLRLMATENIEPRTQLGFYFGAIQRHHVFIGGFHDMSLVTTTNESARQRFRPLRVSANSADTADLVASIMALEVARLALALESDGAERPLAARFQLVTENARTRAALLRFSQTLMERAVGHIANHRDACNAEVRVNPACGLGLVLESSEHIAAGEEIFISYGAEFGAYDAISPFWDRLADPAWRSFFERVREAGTRIIVGHIPRRPDPGVVPSVGTDLRRITRNGRGALPTGGTLFVVCGPRHDDAFCMSWVEEVYEATNTFGGEYDPAELPLMGEARPGVIHGFMVSPAVAAGEEEDEEGEENAEEESGAEGE